MKHKNILYSIDLVVYPCSIWVAIDCSDDFLKEKFKEDFPLLDEKLGAYVCMLQSKDFMMRFRNESCMTIQLLSHEAVHAALYIFDYMGCMVDYNNQEPFAFLVDCIANFCNEVKIKI